MPEREQARYSPSPYVAVEAHVDLLGLEHDFFLNKGYVNNLHIININMSIKNISVLLSMLLDKRKKVLQLPW